MASGRIKGIATNSEPEELSNKYVAIDFYSERNMHLGKHYIEMGELEANANKPFEVYFKLQNVDYYQVSIVNEKDPEATLIQIINQEITKPERVIYVALAMILFW